MILIRNAILFLLPLLAGLHIYIGGAIGYNLEFMPGDFGDARFNMYILEHGHKFFFGDLKSFWEAPFMYPDKEVITYSDNLLGSLPIYSFFRSWTSRETAFQLWIITLTVLNYSSAFFLFKRLFSSYGAAAIGAFIFAFSIALYSQINHAQTFPRFAVPIALYFAIKFAETFSTKHFILTILTVVYQFYCAIYLGFLIVPCITVFWVVVAFASQTKFISAIRKPGWWLGILSGLIIGALAMAPLMLPYIRRTELTDQILKDYQDIIVSLPSFISYFYAQDGTVLWEIFKGTGYHLVAFWDQMLFPGMLAWIGILSVVLFSIFQWRKVSKVTIGLIISFIVCFFLFLRIDDSSLYSMLFNVPGYDSMRALARYINIELIFFSWGGAFLVALMLKKYSKQAFIISLISCVIVIADNYVTPGSIIKELSMDFHVREKNMLRKLESIPAGSIVAYLPDTVKMNPIIYHIDAMLATQTKNLISINGYSGHCHWAYNSFWKNPNIENLNYWLSHSGLDTIKTKVHIVR